MFNTRSAGSTSPTLYIEEAKIEVPLVLAETIHDKIRRYAVDNNIPYWELDSLIKHETGGTYDPLIQSNVRYNFSSSRRGIVAGQREKSYGLVQIHLPDWPSVSYEQATDIDFSLQFAVDHWDERSTMWVYWYKQYH